MPFQSGTVQVSKDATQVCGVPENGVRLKNTGDARVYVGGQDAQEYPLEPGEAETFSGVKARETPVVPAPADDLHPAVLYARADKGTVPVVWLTASW